MREQTVGLIEDAGTFSSFYRKGLSNHLPMALAALDGLGATAEQVAAFAASYRNKLEPMPAPAGVVAEETAESFLGRPEAEASWVVYFENALGRGGARPVLESWLPRLMPGVGASAFHGLLRTAYAADLGSRSELARALAHWASAYETLGSLPSVSGPALSPAEVLAGLAGDPRWTPRRYAGSLISLRMRLAAAEADFPVIVASAGVPELRSLSRALIEAYVATGDFTVLHGVTACDAFAVLVPFLKEADLGLRYLWQALAAAYLSAGGPKAGRPLGGNENLSWEEILRLARDARDEHDVKFAYACRRLFLRYGEQVYRRAASRAFSRRPVTGAKIFQRPL